MNQPSRQKQLEAILHDYLQAVDRGQGPDQEELLRRHADLADELRAFFADEGKMDRVAQALNQAHLGDITIGADDAPGAENGCPRIRYFGDYEILQEIARGGMGIVYKARQVSLNRVVALKMILAGQLASEADVHRFRAEAEAAANLDHPNIVPIHEVGQHGGQHYFSMKLIEGESLAAALPSLLAEPKRGVELLALVARAVHHAHQRGILHRDLKPSNILIDRRGQPHVTDFGLAKRVEGDSGLTRSGAILGTPSYMAPEQASAKKGLSTAVDVYSLGAILYELLTGVPPFRAATPLDTLMQVVEREPTKPSVLNLRVNRDLQTICLKCLEKDPQRRYGSAEAFAEDLERWLAGQPILARPSPTWERTVKWAQRKPALASLVAVSVVGTAMLLIGGLVFNAELQLAFQDVTQRQNDLDQAKKTIEKANDATREANRLADERAVHARGILFTANSAAMRPANPGLALALAIEGAELNPGLLANDTLLAALDVCREQKMLSGHQAAVLFTTFSPDGGRVLTTSADKTARIWNAMTGALVATLQGHEQAVVSASFSPDGSRVATISRDETARTWDAASGQHLATMRLRERQISAGYYSVRFSPDGRRLVAAFGPYTAAIWETDTGKEVALLKGHQAPVSSAAFSADGKRVVTGSFDQTARIWDAESGKQLLILQGHKCAILHALFSPDDQRVLTTGGGYVNVTRWLPSGDPTFMLDGNGYSTDEHMAGRIWDAATGKELATLKWPENDRGFVRTALFSRDGSKIVTAGFESLSVGRVSGSPNVWDAKTGKLLLTLKHEEIKYGITGAAFSPEGLKVATVSDDKTACLWDATTGKPEVIFKGHEGKVVCAAFSPDGQRLVTASEDMTARIWDASYGPEADARKGIWSGIYGATFSPDGRLLLATYVDQNKVHTVVWDTQTGRQRVRLQDARANNASFSPDGKKVITGSSDNQIHIWDTATGKELAVLGPEKEASMAAFSEDGRLVVITDHTDRGSGHVWNAVTGKKLAVLNGDEVHRIRSARFSPEGEHVVTISTGTGPGGNSRGGGPITRGSGPGGPWVYNDAVIACVWDATTGTKLIWLKDVSSPLAEMATFAVFRFDGKWLLTGPGSEQTANLWDLSTASSEISSPHKGKGMSIMKRSVPIVTAKSEIASPQLALKGHEKSVEFASFSPDGSRVVTASEDRTARIWDARTGAVLAVLKGHQEGLLFAYFSPDGRMVLTRASDNTMRLWDALTGQELATFSVGSPPSNRSYRSTGFSADGQRVFAVSIGEASIWPVDILAAAKERKPRDMTLVERERFELGRSAP
jgi:WD40 repeat protein/tRNA A-37 threonylcarbamoyl transferase component Bud32